MADTLLEIGGPETFTVVKETRTVLVETKTSPTTLIVQAPPVVTTVTAAPTDPMVITAEYNPTQVIVTNGPMGPEGPEGPAGPIGPQGEPGVSDVPGPAGPQGDIGPMGPSGPEGPAGPEGPQGEPGVSDIPGPEGPVGATGPQGPQGVEGPIGPIGATGPQGIQGVPGPLGPMGPQGLVGPQGDTGPAGPQGEIGETGAVGATGAQGDQGIQGDPGPIGPTGLTGPPGEQGEQGIDGEQGPPGPTGLTGPVGPDGPVGPPGPEGPEGPMGPGGMAQVLETMITVLPERATAPNSYRLSGADGLYIQQQGADVLVRSSGVQPSAHQTKHQPGGTDALLNNAWLDVANLYTKRQTITPGPFAPNVQLELTGGNPGYPGLLFKDINQAAGYQKALISFATQYIRFTFLSDDETTEALGNMALNRSGDLRLTGQLTAAGLASTPINADFISSGMVADARLSVNVLKYPGGFPGGATLFLNANGAFVGATATAGPHQASHQPGGADTLANNAWTNQANVFTIQQIYASTFPQVKIQGTGTLGVHLYDTGGVANNKRWELATFGETFLIRAVDDTGQSVLNDPLTVKRKGIVTISGANDGQLRFYDSAQPVDQRLFRIQNFNQLLYFMATDDAVTTNTGTVLMHRTGMMQMPKLWIHGGGASPLSGQIKFGDGSGWKLIMGPDVPAGGERFTFTDNGNLDLYGRLLAYGGQFQKKVIINGAADYPPNSSQLELQGGVHPAMVLNDIAQVADSRKARIIYYQGAIKFDFVNDAESLNLGGSVTINRDGTLAVPGTLSVTTLYCASNGNFAGGLQMTNANSLFRFDGATSNLMHFAQVGVAAPTFNTRSLGTKIVFYPNLTNASSDYAIGMENASLWFSIPVPTGNFFRWYEGITQSMMLGSGVLTIGNMLSIGGDSAVSPGRSWIRGNGVNHLVINGPPGGYVYLGLDSGSYSWISGCTFAPGGALTVPSTLTASAALIVSGAVTLYGSTAMNAISCTTINTNNYTITCGPLNVSGKQTVFGGSTGAYNVAPIEIQMPANPRIAFHWPGAVASQLGMDSAGTIRTFDNPGTGFAAFACAALTSYAINCHAITSHGINCQGNPVTASSYNATTSGGVSYFSHVYPLTNAGGHNLGNQLMKWSGIALSLGPSATATYIVTDSTGWLFYLSSERGTKKDIEPLTLEHAQAVLDRLVPYRYRDIKDVTNRPKVAGFMVEDTMDSGNEELVTYYNDKPASVSYDRIGVYLSMVVKDMQRRIDELEARVH